jgi:hypothetical protein
MAYARQRGDTQSPSEPEMSRCLLTSTAGLTPAARTPGRGETVPNPHTPAARVRHAAADAPSPLINRRESSNVVGRNVIPKPVFTVAFVTPGIRIMLVGRFLGNFGTEDLVNCVPVRP